MSFVIMLKGLHGYTLQRQASDPLYTAEGFGSLHTTKLRAILSMRVTCVPELNLNLAVFY